MFTHTNIGLIEKNSTKKSLKEKEDIYSYLNIEDITDADYTDTKRVCEDFEINNLQNVAICVFKVILCC